MSKPKTPAPAASAPAPKANSAAPEKSANPEKPVPAETRPTSLFFPLLLTFMAVFPLAIGIGTARIKASTARVTALPPAKDESSVPKAPPVLDRRLGDEQLLERRYEVALQYYESLGGGADLERLPPEITYRRALCLEGLGKWAEALDLLRKVAETTDQPVLSAAATFGQARLWLRQNQPALAEELLRKLVLHSASPADVPTEMITSAAFLVPLLVAQQSTTRVREANQCGEAQVAELFPALFETSLRWVDHIEVGQDFMADALSPANGLSIQLHDWKPDATLEGITVDLHCVDQPLLTVIEQLAAKCGCHVEIWPLTDSLSAQQHVSLELQKFPLGALLTLLRPEQHSAWTLSDHSLVIQPAAEQDPVVRRMLTQTIVTLLQWRPDHPLANQVRFAAAELAEAEGFLTEAAAVFAELTGPKSSPVALRAGFCAAINFSQLGEYRRASQQLKHVVDGAPDSDMRSVAMLMLGRLMLDLGETQEAVFQLRRAMEPNHPKRIQTRAAVILGLAYLVQEKYELAAEAVFSQKLQFEEPGVRNAASFITAWSRWKALDGEMQDREATYIYRSLLSLKLESDWLGQTGQLMIGRAYAQLGFEDQMAELFCHLLTAGTTQSVAAEMMYSLADYDWVRGDVDSAEMLWRQLSAGPSRHVANLARFRLAESALTSGHAADCLEFCELLNPDDGLQRAEIQKLMGRAFEALGEDTLAARCYAGQLTLP